jgi:archaeosortase A (PGF-CTERM-specific)
MEEPIGLLVSKIGEVIGVNSMALELGIIMTGALFLGLGFHRKKDMKSRYYAAIGWIFTGLYFYLQSGHYVEISDPVLVLMTASALPGSIALAIWEIKNENTPDALQWLRGCFTWAVVPYFVIFSVPYLNMALIQLTAESTELMLEFCGLGNYHIGEMMVARDGAPDIPVSEWDGNKWILTESLAEEGFYVQFFDSDGMVIVQFIMACSGLQSMIIFVGAIGALSSVSWKRRARGLLIALPTIYVLNMFRNAGIVWLTESYPNWSLLGIEMFDFTHSYAAKAISLFAMFLMAIALFDLLPELHKHIMKILNPILDVAGKITRTNKSS